MGFEDERTIYKRSDKGKKVTDNAIPQWNKLKFNNKEVDITRTITVGRDKDCDIPFPGDSMVSRKHCKVEIIGDALFVTDLNSTNGTYVNKTPLGKGKKVKLKKGDIIYLGSQRLNLG